MEEKIVTSTIREQIYDILRKRIYDGYYESGTKLIDQEVCDEFHVSRSPVREAFRLLQAEGLLVGTSNRSLYVRSYSKKDVSNIYDIEIMMQDAGLRILANHMSDEQRENLKHLLSEFKEVHDSKDFAASLKLCEKFHGEVIEFCDNELLTSMYQNLSLANHRFRKISLKDPNRFDQAYFEHCSIIQNLLDGNVDKAKEIMRQHLENACNIVLLHTPENVNFESNETISVEKK